MNESVVEKLKRVGLTEYEARVYLSLLRDHLNSASKLSKKSGVPRTKIYSVLRSLHEKSISRLSQAVLVHSFLSISARRSLALSPTMFL
jgi:sugar-specific transcriptional regulator TrmB